MAMYRVGKIRFADGDPDGGEGGGGGGGGGGDNDRTFTQEEVNRIATTQSDKAERSAKRKFEEELAEKLGGKSIEDMTAMMAALQSKEDEKKTEVEKALEAATVTKTEADAIKREAAQDRYEARLERALTKAGMDEKIQATVSVPGINFESSAEDIAEAIEKLKTDIPAFFAAPGEGRPIPKADPKIKAARPGSNSGASEGMGRFDRLFPKKTD